jgi:hypothetical protein
VSSNFFVVTGRPKTSIFLTMLRQFIALIPCLILFGKIWGLWGIIAAAPVADGFSFLLTLIMITRELKKLKTRGSIAKAQHIGSRQESAPVRFGACGFAKPACERCVPAVFRACRAECARAGCALCRERFSCVVYA